MDYNYTKTIPINMARQMAEKVMEMHFAETGMEGILYESSGDWIEKVRAAGNEILDAEDFAACSEQYLTYGDHFQQATRSYFGDTRRALRRAAKKVTITTTTVVTTQVEEDIECIEEIVKDPRVYALGFTIGGKLIPEMGLKIGETNRPGMEHRLKEHHKSSGFAGTLIVLAEYRHKNHKALEGLIHDNLKRKGKWNNKEESTADEWFFTDLEELETIVAASIAYLDC